MKAWKKENTAVKKTIYNLQPALKDYSMCFKENDKKVVLCTELSTEFADDTVCLC